MLESIQDTSMQHHRPGRAVALAVGLLVSVVAASVDPAATVASATQAVVAPTPTLSEQDQSFVSGATELTDLTEAEATYIIRNRPDLASMIPVAVTDVTHVSVSSSPSAVATATSPNLPVPQRWCRVWTRRKIRNRAGMVLFSFKMTQAWLYNHTRVWPYTPRTTWDVTDWGHWLGGWYYNGIVDSGGYYKFQRGLSPYAIHRSYRTGQFRTADIAGGITVNVPLFIEKLYNGDWVSTTKYGLPGCRNA